MAGRSEIALLLSRKSSFALFHGQMNNLLRASLFVSDVRKGSCKVKKKKSFPFQLVGNLQLAKGPAQRRPPLLIPAASIHWGTYSNRTG